MKRMPTLAEALEIFRRGPAALEAALAGVTGEELDFHPGPGKWNILQIIRHVADTEIVAGMRLRMVAAEGGDPATRPTLTPFNQDSWADNLDYEDADIAEAFTTFHVLRNDTAKLLSNLPPEVFEYTGLHLERGELTLLSLVEIFGNHVLKHADQIKAARKAFKALAGLKAK
jgi:DinB superfamily